MQKSSGVLVLILGILSFTGFGCLTGLPAWIIGNQSLKDIDRGASDPNDRGLVQAGRILGMVSCIIVFAIVGFYFLVIAGVASLAIFGSHTS
jgi:hypothetical protein